MQIETTGMITNKNRQITNNNAELNAIGHEQIEGQMLNDLLLRE
jgi:hypothetical protein